MGVVTYDLLSGAYNFCCDVVLSMNNDVLSLQTIRDKCERHGFIKVREKQ